MKGTGKYIYESKLMAEGEAAKGLISTFSLQLNVVAKID